MKQKDIYIQAFYSIKPRSNVKTTSSGWMDNKENIQYDEQVIITRGYKEKAIAPKILLNLSKQKIERNGFNPDAMDFREMFKYFFSGYSQYMNEVMSKLDPVFMESILKEFEAEMEADKASKAQEVRSIYENAKAETNEISSS